MSKPVLFLVHGIGRHKKGWSEAPDGPVSALETAMRKYSCFASGEKLSKYLEVVEIRYDDIFDSVLAQWSNLAASLPVAPGINWLDSVKKVLDEAGNDSNTFARYGGDVLLYKGFDLIARAVRLRVNSVISATMHRAYANAKAAGSAAPPFSVLAHSMGTAVAQDALFQLATNDWTPDHTTLRAQAPAIAALATNPDLSPEQGADFDAARQAGNLRVGLDSLYLVADTSPLLHRAAGLYSNYQPRPGNFDCGAVCTIAHELDPVCNIGSRGFVVPPRPSAMTLTVKHVHDTNVHGFAHYLSHPRVHAQLFVRLIPAFLPEFKDQAQQIAQAAEWNGFGGALADRADGVRLALHDKLIAIRTDTASVASLRDAIKALFGIAGDV